MASQHINASGSAGEVAQGQKQSLLSMLCEGLTLSNLEKSMWALLLRDASHPGKYRYQLFNENGFYTHHTFSSLEDAFNDAFRCGFCRIDKGAIERMFGAEPWGAAK